MSSLTVHKPLALTTMAEADLKHTGFCMGTYDMVECNDCPCEVECLDLFELEQELKDGEGRRPKRDK